MIIYPLLPEELDDNTLEQQIEAIAQTLLSVHYYQLFYTAYTPTDAELNSWQVISKGWHCSDKFQDDKYYLWATECGANYKNLVEMGLQACKEWEYRFSEPEELSKGMTTRQLATHDKAAIIEWARDNVPDLQVIIDSKYAVKDDCIDLESRIDTETTTPFPLDMPDEYIIYKGISKFPGTYNDEPNVIESYRNYYRAKLTKDAKWTRRNKPEWL